MRESNLTRTVTSYISDVTVIDKETEQAIRTSVTVVRNTDKERQRVLGDKYQLAYVHSTDTAETKYTMPLSKFIELATPIPYVTENTQENKGGNE